MKAIILAAALAAASALPAAAEIFPQNVETREYVMRADPAEVRPGLEYVVSGRRTGRTVRVVEGQPRWSEYRRTLTEHRHLRESAPDGPVIVVVD